MYISDVHCGIDQGFGYEGLWQYRNALEKQGYATLLVDDELGGVIGRNYEDPYGQGRITFTDNG